MWDILNKPVVCIYGLLSVDDVKHDKITLVRRLAKPGPRGGVDPT